MFRGLHVRLQGFQGRVSEFFGRITGISGLNSDVLGRISGNLYTRVQNRAVQNTM